MPELPEVQTVVSDLNEILPGQNLEKIEIYDPKVWFQAKLDPDGFDNKKLIKVTRRGKYIIYDFTDRYLVQHLRMTGKMLAHDSEKIPHNIKIGESPQLRLSLIFNKDHLVFYDSRRFGTFTSIADLDAYFASKSLAPEMLGSSAKPQLALDHYLQQAERSSRPIKNTLLDQSILCGPGNIYADEALHATGIHPLTPTNRIASSDHRALFQALQEVMRQAIAKRGTSAANYLDVNGNPGVFKQYLKVYKRAGDDCLTCQNESIQRIKIGGRSSHFCPDCQVLTTN